jgi:hypothetical protein
MRRPESDRIAAMRALQASADEHGGTPRWMAVSKEVGVPRDTLKTWWGQRKVHVLRPAPDPASIPEGHDALTADDPLVFLRLEFLATAEDIEIARGIAIGAVPGLRKHRLELFDRYRAALAEASKRGPRKTPAEVEAEVRRLVQSAPAALRTAIADELRRAGVVA